MPAKLDESLLKETVSAYLSADHNTAETARILGIARSTVQNRLAQASKRGLVPRREWAPATPEGFAIKGVSSYVDGDGEVRGQWFKVERDKENLSEFLTVIDEAFMDFVGKAPPIPAPSPAILDRDLLTVYVLSDHHLGMYAWAQETGENYDTAIAADLLISAMTDLVENTPDSHYAVVLNLGDFFHSDNDQNRTQRGGNALDSDTRFAKVLRIGVDLTIHTIQLALHKHAEVEYRALAGNHDPYASLALALAVAKFFESEPRVQVNTDPSYFYVRQFGKTMIAATHGDMARPEDMPGIMASRWPEVWGATEWRYAYIGHVHHRGKGGGERHGVVWETFQSLTAKDNWHSQMGYTSGRSMTAITLHMGMGERFRTMRSIDRKGQSDVV